MSWIQPDPYDYRLFEALDLTSAFGRLCLILSPALRVEPRLLRNARRRYLPRTDAGLENRFWFSRLVDSRSTRSVHLRSGLARLLVDHLARHQGTERLTSALAFITEHTRDWDELDRLEQSLRWAIREDDQQRVGDLLRDLLRRIGASSQGRERADLARWIKGALPPLQGATDKHRESSWLAQFAGAALGDTGIVLRGHSTQPDVMPEWLGALLPRGAGLSLGLRLGRSGDSLILECLSPEPSLPRLDLTTPAPAPVRIECENETDKSPGWVPLFVGCRIPVRRGCRALVLQTLDGRRYRLASSTEGEAAAPAPPPSARVLLVHAPGDEALARRMAEALEQQSVRVRVQQSASPHGGPEALIADPEEQLVGLWSERAAKTYEADADGMRRAVSAVPSAPGYRVLVTLDKTPVPVGFVSAGVPPARLDLSDASTEWGPEEAKKLLAALSAPQQRELRVLRADKSVESFQPETIARAITEALRAVERVGAKTERHIRSRADKLAQQVVEALRRRYPRGGVIDTAEISDEIERVLVRAGEHEAGRAYVQRKVEVVTEEEFDVFVSYALADQPIARELSKRLQAAGLGVVLDDEVEAPANWQIMSERKLRAARCVLVLWSRAARDSAFVRDEAEWAVRNNKYLSAVLDDFASIPKEFGRYRSADLRDWPRKRGSEVLFEWFLEDIRKFVTAGPQPGEPFELESARNAEVDDLLAELKDANTPPPRRLEIGDRLAEVGDPRRGVGLDANGLPDIDWVEIPAGPFLYGEDKQTRELPTFHIARYPVTNAQYQAFIDANGYQEARWWKSLAERIEKPEQSHWSTPNRPRTNVSWYEAVAFCRWLSAQLGFKVRLSTELEWEKAARGTDGRECPWGDGYHSGYANVNEKLMKAGEYDLAETSAVGLYLQGASPYGVLDMVGNVFEWCINEYRAPENTRVSGTESRPLRGLSWYYFPGHLRVDVRGVNTSPKASDYGIGFRVLCSSPIE